MKMYSLSKSFFSKNSIDINNRVWHRENREWYFDRENKGISDTVICSGKILELEHDMYFR